MEPQYEIALGFLKAVLGASVNKMVNDAVGQYIQRETARVEVNLGDLLAQVKAYRKADPDFGHAHARVVEAEREAVGKDPVDGTPYTEAPATTRRRLKKSVSKTFLDFLGQAAQRCERACTTTSVPGNRPLRECV